MEMNKGSVYVEEYKLGVMSTERMRIPCLRPHRQRQGAGVQKVTYFTRWNQGVLGLKFHFLLPHTIHFLSFVVVTKDTPYSVT